MVTDAIKIKIWICNLLNLSSGIWHKSGARINLISPGRDRFSVFVSCDCCFLVFLFYFMATVLISLVM